MCRSRARLRTARYPLKNADLVQGISAPGHARPRNGHQVPTSVGASCSILRIVAGLKLVGKALFDVVEVEPEARDSNSHDNERNHAYPETRHLSNAIWSLRAPRCLIETGGALRGGPVASRR